MSEETVIVTCAASLVVPSSLAAIRTESSIRYRFIGVDATDEPLAREYLDDFYVVPYATAPDYVTTLIEIIQRTRSRFLLVLSDNEALVLSEPDIRQRIEALDCIPLLPAHDAVRTCVDKGLFMQFLQQFPDTAEDFRLIDSAQDLPQCADMFKYPENRFIVKPRTGCGSRGVMLIDARAHDIERLLSRHDKHYKIEYVLNALKNTTGLNLLAMPYYPGHDYNIDLLCQKGRVLYSLIQKRIDPKMGAIMTAEIVQDSDIEELIKNLASRLNITGLINIEVARRIGDDKPRVYEINPRPSAAFAFMYYQKADVLTDLIRVLQGEIVAAKEFLPMRIKRVWSQVYRYAQ